MSQPVFVTVPTKEAVAYLTELPSRLQDKASGRQMAYRGYEVNTPQYQARLSLAWLGLFYTLAAGKRNRGRR
ncbi:MAG: hypothetical protein ACRC8Q_07420 [Aeromonas sp.]